MYIVDAVITTAPDSHMHDTSVQELETMPAPAARPLAGQKDASLRAAGGPLP